MTADETSPVPYPFGPSAPAPQAVPAPAPEPQPPHQAAPDPFAASGPSTAGTTVVGSEPMAAPPPPASTTGYPAPAPQDAAPRRSRHPVVAFLRSPIEAASWWALLAIILGLFVAVVSFTVVTTLFSTGGSLLFLLVGIPIIALGLEAARMFARVERWRMSLVDQRPLLPHPYRPVDWSPREPYGAWLRQWAEGTFLDASRWLDVAYAVVALPLAVFEFVTVTVVWSLAIGLVLTPVVYLVARSAGLEPVIFTGRLNLTPEGALAIGFVVGLVLLPVAASITRGLALLHRAVAQGLLCTDQNEALRRDVARLRDSRTATLELEASELRRIERDLHDGAQQRLVKLAIDLSLAEDRLATDPDGARALIVESRDQARLALAELREVVRGAAPAILMDRGLTAALASVAGRNPVPTFVDSALPANERLPHSVERAAYYVVAEALANVSKHAGATRCDVLLRMAPGYLMAEVRDNGRGGAEATAGGGLAGLRDRVEALDGRLDLMSPAGGPTVVRAWLPVPAA